MFGRPFHYNRLRSLERGFIHHEAALDKLQGLFQGRTVEIGRARACKGKQQDQAGAGGSTGAILLTIGQTAGEDDAGVGGACSGFVRYQPTFSPCPSLQAGPAKLLDTIHTCGKAQATSSAQWLPHVALTGPGWMHQPPRLGLQAMQVMPSHTKPSASPCDPHKRHQYARLRATDGPQGWVPLLVEGV